MNKLKKISDVPFKIKIVGFNVHKASGEGVREFVKQFRKSLFYDNCEFIPFVEHKNMPGIYHASDAFIMTSIQEGQPVSAIEAACCGLPVFSTRCGGVEDYVTDFTGRIYNIMDADSFAEGLKDFLEGRIVFDSKKIRSETVRRFGKEAFTNAFVHAFHEVISQKNNLDKEAVVI